MIKLYYDNSKDLYEGLIIEKDDAGVQHQVGQVFPAFRDKYGLLFATAPDMYKVLKRLYKIAAKDCGVCIHLEQALIEAQEVLTKVKGKEV